jgi:hypothetical protein
MEKILCAAIKRLSPRDCHDPYWKNDIMNIELGYRHCDIFVRFPGEMDGSQQGFYTSTGRYVDREEGFKIAEAANQIMKITGSYGMLFSEDLY